MSDKNGGMGISRAVAADGTAGLNPEAVVEQLRALQQQIPQIELPPAKRNALRAAQVNPELTVAAINAIGASESLQGTIGSKPEELLEEQSEINRWTAVETELRVMLRRVSSTILVRRHRLGLAALRTSNIGRQLVRNGEHETLQTHVEGMKRMRKFVRRLSKAPAGPPVTQPQPEPQKQ